MVTCRPVIPRSRHLVVLRRLLARNPVVALLGARQAGKTTLARQVAAGTRRSTVFDLERAADVGASRGPGTRAGPARGNRRPRRDPAAPGSVPGAARAGRPASNAGPLPGARQRRAGTAAAERRVTGGPHRLSRVARLLARRGRAGCARPPLAARRLPEVVHGPLDRRERSVAADVRPDVPGARRAAAGHRHSLGHPRSDSGRCSPTTTARSGTPRSSADPSACPTTRCGATSRPSKPPSWSACCGRGPRTSAKRQVKSPKVYVRDSGLLHTLLDIDDLRAPRTPSRRWAPRGKGSSSKR